jgi:hypothetical protein
MAVSNDEFWEEFLGESEETIMEPPPKMKRQESSGMLVKSGLLYL